MQLVIYPINVLGSTSAPPYHLKSEMSFGVSEKVI